jgi:glycosyltransferase involved in cell wall biosynthesis
MNVLHTDFHQGWGGQAARVLMVCRELQRRGHRPLIAAPPGELTRRAREAGVPVDDGFAFRPPARVLSFLRDARRLARLLREGGYEVLHTHGSQDTWVGAVARSMGGRPRLFVATRHNTKPVRFTAANRWLWGRAVDHIILVSESVRENFRAFLKAGVVADRKITVIHSAYRVEMFHEGVVPERLRRTLGLEGRGPILGVLARLVEDKGHMHLFRALEIVRGRYPQAVLLVAGRGPLEAALHEEVRRRGLETSVLFLGFRDDAAEITALLDVAVLPSIGCDASSASIKEAMAMGRPVVATDIGGAREILQDGVTGIVVPPANPEALAGAILSLLDDPARAKAMGERAREIVRARFGPAVLAAAELGVYESLLGSGRAPAKDAAAATEAASGGSRA